MIRFRSICILIFILLSMLFFLTSCKYFLRSDGKIDDNNIDRENNLDNRDSIDDSEKENDTDDDKAEPQEKDSNDVDDTNDTTTSDNIDEPEEQSNIKIIAENQDSIQYVVNRERHLSSDYIPSDLVSIVDIVPTCLQNAEINQMRKEAAEALSKMFDAAKDEINVQLYARSGYRSYSTQDSLYSSYVSSHGKEAADTFSAKPGESEHQTGLAMDISSESVNYLLTENFGLTNEGKWIAENSHRFGFIVRYPEGMESITGYMYEPWHMRYLGIETATAVYESGLTLEEFYFGGGN